ncbi:hypothetical protein ScPMuIL_018317 [Solemya velum]
MLKFSKSGEAAQDRRSSKYGGSPCLKCEGSAPNPEEQLETDRSVGRSVGQAGGRAAPFDEVFIPMPVDRRRIGEKKVEKLQQKIQDIEKEIDEKQNLARKVSRLRQIESASEKQRFKILEKYETTKSPHPSDRRAWASPDPTPTLLGREMERIYGRESANELARSPIQGRVIDDIMAQRNREFSHKQNETAMHTRYLSMERQWIQAARDRVREKRDVLLGIISPVPTPDSTAKSETDWPVWLYRPGAATQPPPPPRRSPRSPEDGAHSVESYINQTVETLPDTMDRIWQLRHNINQHYETYRKPYKGELGVHTYKPWQMDDYFMVRGLVDELIDNFLNMIFIPTHPLIERDVYSAMIKADQHEGVKVSDALSERTAIQLLADEMFLDATGDLTQAVVQDVLYMYGSFRNRTDSMMMKIAEMIALRIQNARPYTDPDYGPFTQSFFETQRHRDQTWQDVWGHSQPLQLEGAVERGVHDKFEDPDVVVLDYNSFIPIELKRYEHMKSDTNEMKIEKNSYKAYLNMERNYWMKMKSKMVRTNIASKCHGVYCVQPSHNHCFLAAGTVHGDIIVYHTQTDPWRPVRFFNNEAKQDDPVMDIAWTLDNTQLTSVTKSGLLQLWSFNGGLSSSTMSKLDLKADNFGIYPKTLKLLLKLDVGRREFMFKKGPLADQKVLDKNCGPMNSVFFPNLTMTGSQNTVVVGLDNGDLMKCDLEMAVNNPTSDANFQKASKFINPKINGLMEAPNVIGKEINADLFRQHKYPVMHMSFVENLKSLVTVDRKGYVYFWKYNRKYWNKCGWFEPFKKYRMKLEKTTYVPSTEMPKEIFNDHAKLDQTGKSRPRTRQDIAKDREDIQEEIDNAELGDPWHEEYLKPQDLKVTAHVTVVVMDLISRELWDYRREMTITDNEFTEMSQQDNSSLGVSRVLGPTGSEYIFILNNGKLRGISLTTGSLVLLAEDPDKYPGFNGSFISSRLLNLPKNSKMITICTNGKIFAVAYAKKFSALTTIRLDDENTDSERIGMWETYKKLFVGEARKVPVELRVDTVDCEITKHHPSVEMRSLILECMDKGLTDKGHIVMIEQKRRAHAQIDKVENYLSLQHEVENGPFLEDIDTGS